MYAPKKRVDLAPDARIDFTDILMYSEVQWGAEQRDRYEARLTQAIATLGDFPEMGVRRNELGPGLRAQLVEHHVLYYRVTEDLVEVVRILHKRADAGRHLGTRRG